MTEKKATDRALSLANAKAQDLFNCQPFNDPRAAQFDNGVWIWHDQRGRGVVDFEAMVQLAADGTPKSVNVELLYNHR